ncbi:MAG TPA: glycosyl transferase family protein [Bryobacteraceae bacterium]|nr:glycosyl transferase family protein [Bryobacteraceae bacterium]
MKLDHWVASLVVPLALWVLLNGIDDLLIDFSAIAGYIRQAFSSDPNHTIPTEEQLDSAPPRLMAVFVALWKEHRVIQKMIENNVTRLNYPRFEFFIGAYPNDGPTLAAVREAMKRFPHVHLSVCPHDGPTSKADCLNWIYQRMLLFEEENGVRFDMILTHDAEDLIDPDALRWINYYAQWNDMVQIPVLALPKPVGELSYGVYCDEFAEYQFKDMVARQMLGGFIPSNGVGTGFSRRALEKLAEHHQNRIFEPGCLTEDYENGFRVRRLGFRQKFIPIQIRHGRPIATREYFPHEFGAAVRQRSRWVLGITLQSWDFHSAQETIQHLYWFWRDRKGLAGNLVTPLTNIVFAYGATTWAWARITHQDWGFARETASFSAAWVTGLGLQAMHTAIRCWCSQRIYGWRFACAVPLRVVVGNWINCLATSRALWTYGIARIRKRPLRWVKTEHAYPNRAALMTDRKKIGEILAGSEWITAAQLEAAVASKPEHRRLGEHLMDLGLISEEDLYTALSLQNGLPLGKPDPESVSIPITRSVPVSVARKWRVLPFRVAAGELHLAGSDLPGEDMQNDLRRFSSLELRFHLVTPSDYEELARQYLG